MTLRAVLIGLLGAALVCGVTYFNDAVMHHTAFIGNNMPISVYGLLILLVLVNGLVYMVGQRLALSGRELALALVLTLAACCIPGSGLMRTFTTTLVMPHSLVLTRPAWQTPQGDKYWRDGDMLKQLPPHMLVEVTDKNREDVVGGINSGMRRGEKNISFSEVPWSAWTKTLSFWIPLILLLWVGLLGLSLVVHRQWADHEQLPYPIANFANSLLPQAGEAISGVLRNKLFWWGAGVVLIIHLNNYACQWFPDILMTIPTFFEFGPMRALFPAIDMGGGWLFFRPTLYFTVIAFGYFLAADVSLALGLGPILWWAVVGTLLGYGINVKGPSPSPDEFLRIGSYLGMLLVIGYIGRRYYLDVLRGALFLPGGSGASRTSINGARVFLVAMVGFVIYLSTLGGLEWPLATIFAAITVMIFLVMSRIIAETGVFFIQANFYPTILMLGLFGAGAIGPQALLVLGMLTTVLLIDPREAFMPFTVNSLKLLDHRKLSTGKVAPWLIVALLVGLVVAVPTTLYFQYNNGANLSDAWGSQIAPGLAFDNVVAMEQRLEGQGRLQAASNISGWEHFTHMAPEPSLVIALVIGLVLVLLFTFGRLRFTKWPIHPVMFLVWSTYPAMWFSWSFIIGWAIKGAVTKYGGGTAYRQLQPLMIGLVAGEMTAGVITMIIGLLYYLTTGQQPKGFGILPG